MARRIMLVAVLAVTLAGCHELIGYDQPYDGHHGTAYAVIPPAFLPPPGRCRVWIPDWRPARQSPPGRCGRLQYHVPPGAWLVVAPYDPHELIEVWVYSGRVSRYDGLPWVVKILYLDPYTGELVAKEYV